MTDPAVAGSAPARAALAGNPSDGYGGAVLAVAIPSHQAQATAARAPVLDVSPRSELVAAAVRRFAQERHLPAIRTVIRWTTSIPRGVGLGGSSAIVIATLRALCGLYAVTLTRIELAMMALAVETEDLEIAAGPQDRVAQAYGGLTFMDFGQPPAYEPLPEHLLPPLVIAWRADSAQDSAGPHAHLRRRFARGDPAIVEGMRALGELARGARVALLAGDQARLRDCVDGSFEARLRMMSLDPRHVRMIELARACGASANYAGSGGAIVAVCSDAVQQRRVVAAFTDARYGVCTHPDGGAAPPAAA